jgi:hypothetical protein
LRQTGQHFVPSSELKTFLPRFGTVDAECEFTSAAGAEHRMSLVKTLEYLSAARQFVADGERELASQRKAVRRIEQKGEDPRQAILILGEIEEMQQVYVDHRDRLEQQVIDLIRPSD